MRKIVGRLILAGLVACVGLTEPASGQDPPQPDLGKILGRWTLEIYADGQTIALDLLLENSNKVLGGRMSEQMGMFTDAPLKNVKYEGQTLTFEITVSSPPDGMERTWLAELTVGQDMVEGTISNAEVGISAPITGKRTKQNPK